MPAIMRYECNDCSFKMQPGWGGIAYVESYEGNRIILTHPVEDLIRERVLNLPAGTFEFMLYDNPKWWWSKKRKEAFKKKKAIREAALSRCGFLSDCRCFDCLEIQQLDLEKDKREHCFCSSVNVKSTHELLGNECPQCKKGRIVEIDTGAVA